MTTSRRSFGPAALVVVTLVAGCAGDSPSASPFSSLTPTATAAAPTPPSATTTPVTPAPTRTPALPSLQPIPAPTVLPAGAAFDVTWTELSGRAAPSVGGSLTLASMSAWEVPTAVRWKGGAVVAYPTDPYGSYAGPMVWWSPDLVTWRRALQAVPREPGDVSAHTVVVGGPGLAVLGTDVDEEDGPGRARLWTSESGDAWLERSVPEDAHFIWGRPGALVVFGRSTWVSADGLAWVNRGPSPLATLERLHPSNAVIVDDGDVAIVFISLGFDSPTFVHRLQGDGSWQEIGRIDGNVRHAVRGPTGIVALGWTLGDEGVDAAWTSPDGATWQRRAGAVPNGRLVGVATGYVVVGARSYFHGCAGFDPSAQVVNTWTSPDGLAWQLMPEDGAQDHVDLQVVLPEGDRLLAFGLKWSTRDGITEFDDRATPSVWASGPLRPPQAPAPKETSSGCGPG